MHVGNLSDFFRAACLYCARYIFDLIGGNGVAYLSTPLEVSECRIHLVWGSAYPRHRPASLLLFVCM
jgi:hypothetical protein